MNSISYIRNNTGNIIEYLEVTDSAFTGNNWLTNGVDNNICTDGIYQIIYKNTKDIQNKMVITGHTRGSVYSLPKNTAIQVSSNNENAKFIICGNNLTSNNRDDYFVGSISGTTGNDLVRTPSSSSAQAWLTMDASGNLVYSLPSNVSNSYAIYPFYMFYLKEQSNVTISATFKNTGGTTGSSFYLYLKYVNIKTGKIVGSNNSILTQATAQGEQVSKTVKINGNLVVLAYIYCGTAVAGSETTIENFKFFATPTFAPYIVESEEEFNAKRLTGDGTILSLAGTNNIMSSEDIFDVEFNVDYIVNPIAGDSTTVTQSPSGVLSIS